MTVPALRQLNNTEDGTDEDEDGAQSQSDQEPAELLRGPELCVGVVKPVHVLHYTVGVLCAEDHEEGEGEDLEGKTG